MIDIHSHILPGIDDGPQTETDSLAMAHAAIAQGIHTIIATPHHKNGSFDNPGSLITTHVEILNNLFKDLPITVLPGQEIRMNDNIIEQLRSGEAIGLNQSQYVFVEFPFEYVPDDAEQTLFDIQMSGYTPIIVHPERNDQLLSEPNELYHLVRKGALTQVTSGSVIGEFGRSIEKFTHQIIDNNLTHFVASDAHNTKSRGFTMMEAHDAIRTKHGSEASYTFMENSQLLIDNMNVIKTEPFRIKRKKRFGIF